MRRNGLNHALIEAVHACESADTEGNSWTAEEQDAAWTLARFLLALPVEQRMEAMGMKRLISPSSSGMLDVNRYVAWVAVDV